MSNKAGDQIRAMARAKPVEHRETVRAALVRNHGNASGAARELSVSIRTMRRWISADPSLLAGIERVNRGFGV